MARYRNAKTGRVVDVDPEPPEPGRGVPRPKQYAGMLEKLESSSRWERVGDDATPKASDVRAWAKAEGIEVTARGKLPDEVVEQYQAAQGA
jgi:hypothetical protein